MKITIKNDHIQQVANLLFDMKLKAKKSRQRTKLVKLLSNRAHEIADQEKELLKEHCELDEEGEPVKTEDGKGFKPNDIDAFIKDQKELYDEELVIEGGDNREMLRTVKKILEDCDDEFSGQKAAAYDYLCDQFEKEIDKDGTD